MQRESLNRRTFVRSAAMLAGLALVPIRRARAVERVARIGFLIGQGYDANAKAFRDELRAQGYAEGENVVISTGATRDDARAMATMDLDLIVAGALPYALTVREANPRMPMVIATCPGIVSNGFARTLERPGGLYTGMDELPPGVTAKRLTLLRTAVPTATRIALLSTTPGVGGHETQLEDAERTAADLGVSVKPYRAATEAEVTRALAAIVEDGMQGMMSFQGGLALSLRKPIVEFAARHRLPAIYQATLFAEAGGLMAWAPDLVEQYRHAARLTAAVLNGAKPGDLPVKRPDRYFLTVNAGAAREIGLVLPPALLAQASRVIDSAERGA